MTYSGKLLCGSFFFLADVILLKILKNLETVIK